MNHQLPTISLPPISLPTIFLSIVRGVPLLTISLPPISLPPISLPTNCLSTVRSVPLPTTTLPTTTPPTTSYPHLNKPNMNHQPLNNAQVLHWPFVFLVSFPFFLIFLSMFGMAVLDRLYPPQQAPRKQQDSFLERQTRAAELTALVAYTRNCGDRKQEGMSGAFDEVGEAMTRLALGVVAGVKTEKDEKRTRGNEGCCVM